MKKKIFGLAFLLVNIVAQHGYGQTNVTRTSLHGIAAYRSSLTLEWMAAEDSRQREQVHAFETEPNPSGRQLPTDCMSYPRPAPGKIAKLILEMIKNLEGDESVMMTTFIQNLVKCKMIVDTAMFEEEPDFDSLVKAPDIMKGEPHFTLPRVVSMVWIVATDNFHLNKEGWCPVARVSKYLAMAKSPDIAKKMHHIDPIVARVRYIMEEFIQQVTPINIYQKKATKLQQQMQPPPLDNDLNRFEAKRTVRTNRVVESLQDKAHTTERPFALVSMETSPVYLEDGLASSTVKLRLRGLARLFALVWWWIVKF